MPPRPRPSVERADIVVDRALIPVERALIRVERAVIPVERAVVRVLVRSARFETEVRLINGDMAR